MFRRISLMLLVVVFAISCADETTIYNETTEDIVLEENNAILEQSINYNNSGVLNIISADQIAGKTLSGKSEEIAGDYPLTLIAQIKPPSFKNGGENLTASHIHVDGDFAYISYNTSEGGYAGAIDIINVSNPNTPKITSRLYYLNADINAIIYENGYVYAVGGVDSEKSVTATSNAFIAKIVASGGRFNLSAGIIYGFQQGYNSTDIKLDDSAAYVTSGKDGSLTVYKKSDLSVVTEFPSDDLRSVAMYDNTVVVLNAGSGVSILDKFLNLKKEIAIDTDFGTNSKKTIEITADKIIVSEGAKGAGMYSAVNGSFIKYVAIPINPEGVDRSDQVTNAVAVNDEAFLMANGGAGLCLSEEQASGSDLVGVVELEGSINYVASNGDYIFAASGKEGLQIIKMNKPNASLESRCESLTAYNGSALLTVSAGTVKENRGSKRFNSVNVYGSLLLCGTWTVKNDTNIHENGVFEMKGTYVVGKNNARKNIMVGENATFKVEGNLTIYGDLILEDGAELEFIGDESVVNIIGKVIKNGSASVAGNFNDYAKKF